MSVAEEFLHNIDVNALKSELELDVQDIAELAGITENGVYKWAWPKVKNGTRPTYNAILRMLERGATVKTLFGIDYVEKRKDVLPEIDKGIFDSPEFQEGVAKAIEDMKAKGLIK